MEESDSSQSQVTLGSWVTQTKRDSLRKKNVDLVPDVDVIKNGWHVSAVSHCTNIIRTKQTKRTFSHTHTKG